MAWRTQTGKHSKQKGKKDIRALGCCLLYFVLEKDHDVAQAGLELPK